MEYPPLTIVMTTYFPIEQRRDVAERTSNSWASYLHYAGNLNIHIADDGSDYIWTPAVARWFERVTLSAQKRHGVGASLNAGFKKAFEISPLVAYFVDDWAVTEELDLTPWVQLLLEREDVGVVRLGPPHPGISGHVETFTENWQGWGLRLDRSNFAFGHRPALYHQRMIQHYGWFKEDCTALKCEEDYNERFCAKAGPDVVYALAHKWQHLDSIELSAMEPK